MATKKQSRSPLANMTGAQRAIVAATSLFALIGLGTIVFRYLEDWTYAESFYFSVVTLTTVGYGDLTPTTDATRVVVALYILVGVTIAVSAVSVIGAGYLNQRTIKRYEKDD